MQGGQLHSWDTAVTNHVAKSCCWEPRVRCRQGQSYHGSKAAVEATVRFLALAWRLTVSVTDTSGQLLSFKSLGKNAYCYA